MNWRSIFLFIFLGTLGGAAPLQAAVEIPCVVRDGMLWVKVSVPGQSAPLNFLLDSGAGVSVLDKAASQRLGVALGAPRPVRGAAGLALAYQIQGWDAYAGPVPLPRSLLVLDLSGLNSSLSRRVDGLLGLDFLRGRVVQINYAKETIRFLEREELDRSGAEILPLVSRSDALCVSASIAGQAPGWLRVDTGCQGGVQWASPKSEAAKPLARRTIQTDVQLGTTRVSGVSTGLHGQAFFPGESGLLGNGLLSRFIVTLDTRKKQLWLAPL